VAWHRPSLQSTEDQTVNCHRLSPADEHRQVARQRDPHTAVPLSSRSTFQTDRSLDNRARAEIGVRFVHTSRCAMRRMRAQALPRCRRESAEPELNQRVRAISNGHAGLTQSPASTGTSVARHPQDPCHIPRDVVRCTPSVLPGTERRRRLSISRSGSPPIECGIIGCRRVILPCSLIYLASGEHRNTTAAP